MPLDALVIEKDYFAQIQNRNGLMKAVDFDFQFNNIANYINNSIIPILDRLSSDATPGSQDPNLAGAYLQNVGDGTTQWSQIVFNDIQDYSLSYDKLVQTNACSILATGVNEEFVAVTALENGQALISQVNNHPLWKKITSDNIEDRQITEQKIALRSLITRNFSRGILKLQLSENSIRAENIVDNTIPHSALDLYCIDETALGQMATDLLCGTNGVQRIVYGNTVPDNYLNLTMLTAGDKPPPNTRYAIDHTKLHPDFIITDRRLLGYFTGEHLDDECIEGYQIKPKGLEGNRLFAPTQVSLPINDMLEDGCLEIRLFPPFYKQRLGL